MRLKPLAALAGQRLGARPPGGGLKKLFGIG